MEEERKCKNCSKILKRRITRDKVESGRDFRRRQFCDKKCSSKFQHASSPAPTKDIIVNDKPKTPEEEKQLKTAMQVLEEIINDKDVDVITKVNAAGKLIAYQAKKTNVPLTKSQEREQKKEAGPKRFGAGPAPKIVGRIG